MKKFNEFKWFLHSFYNPVADHKMNGTNPMRFNRKNNKFINLINVIFWYLSCKYYSIINGDLKFFAVICYMSWCMILLNFILVCYLVYDWFMLDIQKWPKNLTWLKISDQFFLVLVYQWYGENSMWPIMFFYTTGMCNTSGSQKMTFLLV